MTGTKIAACHQITTGTKNANSTFAENQKMDVANTDVIALDKDYSRKTVVIAELNC